MSSFKSTFRQLIRRPALSVIVIAMLAIGIGATTAMFSWVHTLLMQPLPVSEPDRLVNLGAPGPKPGSTSCNVAGSCEQVFSYPMFRDLEAQQTVFTGIAGHTFFRADLAFDGRTLAGAGLLVSGSYFDVLGIAPALGRLIGPSDEPRVGEGAVVVLSHDYWQSAFGGARDAVGRSIVVNGIQLSVVGVAPEGFKGTTKGTDPQVFVPLTLRWLMEPTRQTAPDNRQAYWLYVFARLRPGLSIEQAAVGINSLYTGILNEIEAPLNEFLPPDVLERFRRRQITVAPGSRGQSEIADETTEPLMLLLGVTVVLLLIVCVNIANLLLARGAARTAELAIRASIGAGPKRLLLQSLGESAVLAVAGGLCSLPVAELILAGIQSMIPLIDVGVSFDVELNPSALIFAAATTLTTVLVFGLIPAFRAMRVQPGAVVKGQAAQAASSRGMNRFRDSLATSQIVFSTLLLALAGLFTQSLANVVQEDLGVNTDAVVSFAVSPRLNGYDAEESQQLFDRIETALAAAPGVTDVAASRVPILTNTNSRSSLTVEGFDAGPTDDTGVSKNDISPGFFRTLEIPLLTGRSFDDADIEGRPRVAVVNQSFLEKFGLGMDSIGTRFAEGRSPETVPDIEIVGVVADSKYSRVKDEVPPQYFLPRHQDRNIGTLSFYVRGAGSADTLFALVRRTVAEIDPALPLANLTTLEQTAGDNVFLDRLVAVFSASFAALATFLAAVGLYGVLAYNVTQRTRELGIRQALGATPGILRSMVLRHVGRLALIGIPLGIVAAILVGRAAASLLFGLSGSDPLVLVSSTAVLIGVVTIAGWLPARQASRVSPMTALRYE